jgi:hypothetical protein
MKLLNLVTLSLALFAVRNVGVKGKNSQTQADSG